MRRSVVGIRYRWCSNSNQQPYPWFHSKNNNQTFIIGLTTIYELTPLGIISDRRVFPFKMPSHLELTVIFITKCIIYKLNRSLYMLTRRYRSKMMTLITQILHIMFVCDNIQFLLIIYPRKFFKLCFIKKENFKLPEQDDEYNMRKRISLM